MKTLTITLAGLLLAVGNAAKAVQPVEHGLQPILARLQAIALRQQALNQQLQSSATLPAERADAYRSYQLAEQERQALVCDLNRSRKLAELVMVTYAGPGNQLDCADRISRTK